MNGLRIHVREKRFDGKPVLGECTIEAAPGEFIALVGPSGAGKSTLLSLVAGLDEDYDGEITWNGEPLSNRGESPAHMGMMFQEPRLMPWLSTLDNVRLAEAERMARDANYHSNANRLLEEVGLGDATAFWPNHLSGGMQRRVALARAFVVEPQLLLIDEPFVSLDMPTGNRLRRSLLRLCERQRPLVLFVTHDLREALALADRVLFLGDTPARVMLDHPVEGARGKDLESAEVAHAQQALLARYPQLLSGILDDARGTTEDDEDNA